ncbi:putative Forkhead box protein G1 [Melia azedarach]|uniref:Forkhead box protein G1 n=2 Tax=Melia azedarach TaxID=155640 RepID=A0ACC1YPZ1_MELAZ|nr:putative Forkhead box protein G1 [Melia azedarach]KAJ4725857.1 putative Forkhead box protein G1 [Melia azedarach]
MFFLPSLHSIIQRVKTHSPLLLCAATWTILLTLTVAMASFAPEVAFVSAISPSSSFSKSCHADGFVRIPLDFPKESVCLPSHMVRRSNLDFFVPTVFAALVVAGSAFVVRSLGLWESARG